jgi:Ca2+:H+ antiporter
MSHLARIDIPPIPPPTLENGRRVAFSPMTEIPPSPQSSSNNEAGSSSRFNALHRGIKFTKAIRIRPFHILSICWRAASPASKCVNLLWPLVPLAIALQYTRDDLHLPVFILSYLAMVPCANLIGFASHESTRRLPKVLGHIFEIILASTPELILLLVLLYKKEYVVIQAAVLGSLLATLLLCLGACFFFGGLIYAEQSFNGAVSELGSDLLLTAYVKSFRSFKHFQRSILIRRRAMGLMIPGAFHATHEQQTAASGHVLIISRVTSIFLIIAYCLYIYFQLRSHNKLYEVMLEHEEEVVNSQAPVHQEPKLCLAECLISLAIALTLVTMLAINLVEGIPYIVKERGVSESFLGLILVPIVEKAAEHITTVEDACNDHMTGAMFHCLGSTIQTALFNTPLVVLVGWASGIPLDLEFEEFNMIVLVLSILVVGSFTRDLKSNWLEGSLCLIIYMLIALGSCFD